MTFGPWLPGAVLTITAVGKPCIITLGKRLVPSQYCRSVADNAVKIFGVNDQVEKLKVTLHNPTPIHSKEKRYLILTRTGWILPNSSKLLWQGPLKTILDGKKPENCVMEFELTDSLGTTVYSRRLFYAVPPKKMKLPNPNLKITNVEKVAEGYMLSLQGIGKCAKTCTCKRKKKAFSRTIISIYCRINA